VVRAGFVLLANPGAAQLHDELIDPVLPILVGIGSGLPRRPAGDVFRDRPRERDSARRALDAYSGRSPVEPLKAWLDAPDS
jgi:hypothetical protein